MCTYVYTHPQIYEKYFDLQSNTKFDKDFMQKNKGQPLRLSLAIREL